MYLVCISISLHVLTEYIINIPLSSTYHHTAMPTTLATDEALMGDPSLTPRHRQAVRTRLENKQLLQAGIDVLTTYEATLY